MASKVGQVDVCAVQLNNVDCVTESDRDANLAAACETIAAAHEARKATSSRAQLFVLPELSSCGYDASAFDQLAVLGEALDGPSYRAFSELSRRLGVYICYGFPRRVTSSGGETTYRICQAVADPRGQLLQWYDKLHLCNYGDCAESRWFSAPTEQRCSTFGVDGVAFGLAICYDIRFPELFRRLALDGGVDVVVHPGGWPRDASFATWHPFVVTRAVENQVLVVSVNRAGGNNGRSIIAGPWVDANVQPRVLGDDAECAWTVADAAAVADTRAAYALRRDRLADYGALALCSRDNAPVCN